MEKIQELLVPMLRKALEVAEKTGEFAMEQAPILLREFYTWHIAKEVVWILAALMIYVLVRYGMSLMGRKESFSWIKDEGYSWEKKVDSMKIRNRYYASQDTYTLRTFLHIGGIIISGYMALGAIYQILYISLAPRLYLIEFFADKL